MSIEDGSDKSFFGCLRRFFSLLCFFFFDIESDEDVFDDESDYDGSGSGITSILCFSSFLNYLFIVSVDCHVMESTNPFVVYNEYLKFPAQNFSSFKFRILYMITVCCRFAQSFKIICIHQPAYFEVVPLCPIQRLSSGRGGEGGVWFTRCIEGREPEIFEVLTFTDDGICEVHPYA